MSVKTDKLNFKDVMKVRGLIKRDSSKVCVDAEMRGLTLTQTQVDEIEEILLESIIPGMDRSNVQKVMQRAITNYLDKLAKNSDNVILFNPAKPKTIREEGINCPFCENRGWLITQRGETDPIQEKCHWCHTTPGSKFMVRKAKGAAPTQTSSSIPPNTDSHSPTQAAPSEFESAAKPLLDGYRDSI